MLVDLVSSNKIFLKLFRLIVSSFYLIISVPNSPLTSTSYHNYIIKQLDIFCQKKKLIQRIILKNLLTDAEIF